MNESQNKRNEMKQAQIEQDELGLEVLDKVAGGNLSCNTYFAYQVVLGGSRLNWGSLNPQPLPPRYNNYHN